MTKIVCILGCLILASTQPTMALTTSSPMMMGRRTIPMMFRQRSSSSSSSSSSLHHRRRRRRSLNHSRKLSYPAMNASNSNDDNDVQESHGDSSRPISKVAVIGGGLAGLSASYHLLDAAASSGNDGRMEISVYDKANVGEGGASSVAGGLLHPFSPRGKLVHFGLDALEHSNHLIEMASRHHADCILRRCIYRVALTSKHVAQLQQTAEHYPQMTTWISKEEMHDNFGIIDSMGGLMLRNGCKVIHVPSYLRGLWEECRAKAGGMKNASIQWKLMENNDMQQLSMDEYDAVILSAGAGILHDEIISDEQHELPVQLVRGQSIEMTVPDDKLTDAFLCGKYMSPLPTNNTSSQRFVIGATHEFKTDALSPADVIEELQGRTHQFAQHLWDNGAVDRLTTGVRMQSNRGAFGRMPIVGRYDASTTSQKGICHENCWIFTGLSSRGIIYHGLFGRWLADAVLHRDEEKLRENFSEYDWWRKKK